MNAKDITIAVCASCASVAPSADVSSEEVGTERKMPARKSAAKIIPMPIAATAPAERWATPAFALSILTGTSIASSRGAARSGGGT